MQQCNNCGHRNRAGIVFCENCGASLIGKMPVDTKSLDDSDAEQAAIVEDIRQPGDEKERGASTFPAGSGLRLELEGSLEPILFQPKAETIFGRRDPATGAMPDIDLTPFAGYRMGVSRRHAAIRFGDEQSLDLWDLGSSNGTFLNGQRLSAHRPYRLHDRDELRLGQMVIRLFFQAAEAPHVEVPAAPTVTKALEPQAVQPARETAKLVGDATAPASEPKAEPVETTDKAPVPTAEQPVPESAQTTAETPEEQPVAESAPPAAEKLESPAPTTTIPQPEPATAVEKAAAPERASTEGAPAPQPESAATEAPKPGPSETTPAAPETPDTEPEAAAQPTSADKPVPEEPKLLEDKAAPEAPKLPSGAQPAGELPERTTATEAEPAPQAATESPPEPEVAPGTETADDSVDDETAGQPTDSPEKKPE